MGAPNHQISGFTRKIFAIAFTAGTVLMLLRIAGYCSSEAVMAGLFYVFAAFTINILILFATILHSCFYKKQYKPIQQNMPALLVNIPFATLYFLILFYL